MRAVQRIGGKLQGFLLVGSIVLAVASILLIFNTIQTAIFGRRREIEVMRLVGASNWYIRVPVRARGPGPGPGRVAVRLRVRPGCSPTCGEVRSPGGSVATLFDQITWTNGKLWWTVAVVSIVGSAISAVVAFISTTWYLRV